MHGWDKTTSGFGKWNSAILELYFRCRFWLIYCHQQVILHRHVKFHCNWTIGCKVIMSYRFFKMAAIESEIYFRFRFWWWYSFEMDIYWHTIFRWDISIYSWDKLLPVSENGRPPFWNSIFGFYFLTNFVICVSFCIGLPNFVKIELPLAESWDHIDFFKMAADRHIGFELDSIRPPTKCNCLSEVAPQIWSW